MVAAADQSNCFEYLCVSICKLCEFSRLKYERSGKQVFLTHFYLNDSFYGAERTIRDVCRIMTRAINKYVGEPYAISRAYAR